MRQKRSVAKRILRAVLCVILGVILLAVLGIGLLTALEYRPGAVEPVTPGRTVSAVPRTGETMNFLSWNVGYGALGDNADFFMDGGKGVRTAGLERVRANIGAIAGTIAALEPDVCFLQEVDRSSTRSHFQDETQLLAGAMPEAAATFANNYKVAYVPYPIPPIGKVDSGLLTLSRFGVSAAERVQLPVPFRWPIRLANLKRCLLVNRIPVEGTEKELVAVNLHLEAYDDGEGKEAQTRQLLELMRAEAEKGNYVIVGGDFNQVFSNVDTSAWPVRPGTWQPGAVSAEAFGGGFSLLMDPRVPTCRSLDRPYAGADPKDFQYYVIDGFIVSGNVSVERLETLDQGFVSSDHNPVLLQVTLKEAE